MLQPCCSSCPGWVNACQGNSGCATLLLTLLVSVSTSWLQSRQQLDIPAEMSWAGLTHAVHVSEILKNVDSLLHFALSMVSTLAGLLHQRLSLAVVEQALMDPVCMMTCFPQLLHNFVYKLPSVAECFGSVPGLINGVRWLVARDMIIAEVLSPPMQAVPACMLTEPLQQRACLNKPLSSVRLAWMHVCPRCIDEHAVRHVVTHWQLPACWSSCWTAPCSRPSSLLFPAAPPQSCPEQELIWDGLVAQTFCRRFLWHELMLWPEDMPDRTLIAMAAEDDLVPSTLVVGQCQAAGSSATLLLHPTAGKTSSSVLLAAVHASPETGCPS